MDRVFEMKMPIKPDDHVSQGVLGGDRMDAKLEEEQRPDEKRKYTFPQ